VLEGEIEVAMGEETIRGGPGTFAAAPPGVVHGFQNAGEGTLRILNVHAPNRGFGEWLRNL
jgi:mannose-6-phosphate isomerase-like protein (cupin superfamily)